MEAALQNLPQRRLWLVAVWILSGLSTSLCRAQETEEPEDLFTLSPFVVEAGEDTGYLPLSSLSGSRLKMEFKDIAASIDVMNSIFLADVGAVLVDEAFIYSAHLENVSETGQDALRGPGAGSSDLRIQHGARAIGINPPTRTKNLFHTLLQQDLYNTERFTIARGPQAILFGIGSPSGIVDTSLKRARMDDTFLNIRGRWDNWGSQRAECDLNLVAVPNVLSVRIAALEDDQRFWLEPGRDHRDRFYGTFTLKPIDRLELRFHRESLDRKASVPGTQLPWDNVSYFFEANSGQPVEDADQFWLVQGGSFEPVLQFNSSTSEEPRFTNLNNRIWIHFGDIVGSVSDPDSGSYDPGDPFFDPDWVPYGNSFFRRSLKDDSYYPVFDKYLFGDLQANRQKGVSTTAYAELLVAREAGLFSNFFIEAAFSRDELDQERGGVFGGTDYMLQVDVNRYLPNGEPNPDAGKVMVYTWGGLIVGSHEREEEARLSASLEMDLRDRSRVLGWHRFGFLVSDRESESNTQRTYRKIGNIGSPVMGENPGDFLDAQLPDRGQSWRKDFSPRNLIMQFYLENNDGYLYPSEESIPWGGALDTWYIPTEDGSFGIFAFDPDGPGMDSAAVSVTNRFRSWSVSWQGQYDLGKVARLVTLLGYREDRMHVKQKVAPDSYTNRFGEHLLLTGSGVIAETKLFPHYNWLIWERDWRNMGNYGNDTIAAVLHLDPWMDRKFSGNFRLSLHFNHSTNNEGYSKQKGANGDFHYGQKGSGTNFGLRLGFDRDKYSLTVNRWTNDLTGVGAGSDNNALLMALYYVESRWMAIEPNSVGEIARNTGGYVEDPNGVDLASSGVVGYQVFAEQASEGWTFDFVANPVPGLRIRANLSKTDSVQSNIGSDWRDWVRNERRPLWDSEIQWWDDSDADGIYRPVIAWDPNQVTDMDGNGIADTEEDGDTLAYITLGDPDNPADVARILSGWENIPILVRPKDLSSSQTIKEYYLRMIEGTHLLQFEGREGQPNPATRQWRFNATATYTIQEGVLENVSFGASARFRDRQFIGTKTRLLEFSMPDGSILPVYTEDPTQPLYGETLWLFDAMVGYRGTLKTGNRGIGYVLQINVRNIFNEDDPYPTSVTGSGQPLRWARTIPRECFLTCSIEF